MTKASKWGKAGLVFMTARDIDIVAAANHVVSGFEAMGHRIAGVHILSDDRAQVSTDSYDVAMTLQEEVTLNPSSELAPAFLGLEMHNHDQGQTSQFAHDAILARCLQALNAALQPDFVQWKDTDFLLPSASFARATRPPSDQEKANVEQHLANRKALPDVETTNAILQDRISNHDPAIFDAQSTPDRLREIFSDGWIDPAILAEQAAADAHAREMEDIEEAAPLRLSAWFMSFAVLLFALPVGVALLIVNMAKGENLRLSSQTAALTGVFVAFQSLGTTANAMETIHKILH